MSEADALIRRLFDLADEVGEQSETQNGVARNVGFDLVDKVSAIAEEHFALHGEPIVDDHPLTPSP